VYTIRIPALISRPVLANGGMFDVTEASNGVQCIVYTLDPEKTAVAIGERLLARMISSKDGSGGGADVCQMS